MAFVFGLILIPLVAIFGVVGNILSLVVLVQHRMRSTTNICLASLAVSDLLLLLSSLAYSSIQLYGISDQKGRRHYDLHNKRQIIGELKIEIENCTISISKGNSYCRRKSSARGSQFKVSPEGL